MKGLVLHRQTEAVSAAFLAAPAHALIITGPAGSGKLALATSLAETVLGLPAGGLPSYPYGLVIRPEAGKSSIGIEAVRQLERFTSLRVPGKTGHDRAIIIENAHLMTPEAQNALLKLLEEPPAGTILILTAASAQTLLPTVRSRSRQLHITKPAADELASYFSNQGFSGQTVKQAYAVSGGLPGLMHALLSQENHPLTQATEWARRLLSQTAYERLLSVDELAKQKPLAADTAFILQQMAHVSLQTATGAAAKRWQSVLAAAYAAGEALAASAQPKLALTDLMLHL